MLNYKLMEMENKTVRKQNDVIVNFKTMTNKQNEHVNGNAPRKLKFVTVEVNEHSSEHGEMFSIDLNYREVYDGDENL